jgi:hypothetical protein
MLTNSAKQKRIKQFFKENFGISASDSEIEEVRLSLFYLARAIHRYNLIKKGLIKEEA